MTTERSAADNSGRDLPAGAPVFEEAVRGRRRRVAGAGEIAEVGEPAGERAPRLAAQPRHARFLPEGSVGPAPAPAPDDVAWLEPNRRFEPEGNA